MLHQSGVDVVVHPLHGENSLENRGISISIDAKFGNLPVTVEQYSPMLLALDAGTIILASPLNAFSISVEANIEPQTAPVLL